MTTWIEEAYSPSSDITFLVQYTQEGDTLVREEVVGFYHGEPEAQWTEYYKDKGVVADIR